jgi:transposase
MRLAQRGSEDEAMWRSRGGLSTKISASVDALGNPVRFILTAGQVHDIVQAEDLISGIPFEHLLADKGYDANWLRVRIAEAGGTPVIPSSRSRSQAIPYDTHIYQERNLVERFFNKIKHFRRIATRYEKAAVSFAAMLCLVGAVIGLRRMSIGPSRRRNPPVILSKRFLRCGAGTPHYTNV